MRLCRRDPHRRALLRSELAGPLDIDDVAADRPVWMVDDWCASTGAVADLEDFVLGDFGDVAAMGEEIRSGEFTSQEQAIERAGPTGMSSWPGHRRR